MVKILFPLAPNPRKVTSDFGPRSGGYHYGTDYKAAIGTTVRAALDGVVVGSSRNTTSAGNTVVIKHKDCYTAYYHLSQISVSKGATVKQGDKIGLSGNSDGGSKVSTGPHLHFMVCRQVKGVWPVYASCLNPEKQTYITEPTKPEPPKTVLVEGKFKVKVKSPTLTIRSGPSTIYGKIGLLQTGATVTVLRTFGSWGQLGTGMWISVKKEYVTRI